MTTSPAVTRIKPHLQTISAPDALRQYPAWLIWRYEHHDGEAKARKIPYYTGGGRRVGVQGRPEDVAALTTFEAARSAAARLGFDGVGFCPLPQWGITALDFDHCLADGGVHPDVERLVAGTYAEFSPSGQGVRAFFQGYIGNNKDQGEPYGFETFSTKGFVTFTGNVLPLSEMLGTENVVAPITDEVLEECARRWGSRGPQRIERDDDPLMSYEPPIGLTPGQIAEALDVLPNDLPYEASHGEPSWVAVGMALHHETGGQGFEIWDEWSKKSPKYTTEKYGRDRWRSFGNLSGRPVTAKSLIKWANAHGAHITTSVATPEQFDAAVATDKPLRFPVVNADEFRQGQPPGWIIKGLLPRAELCVLFGEPGSGKSFLALDIAAAIVRGIEWRGKRTKQGRVVYVAAEGQGGFRNRLTAYRTHHGVDLGVLGLGVVAAAPNLLQLDDVTDLTRSIKAFAGGEGVAVIVVDTFAQTTPGANENAGEDMGRALAHCKRLHRATGALIVLVHHSGKDAAKGARGWSGIKGAADVELEVSRAVGGRKVRVSKQKDGEDGVEWGFDLSVVPIGIDEDGDTVDSCVVVEAAVPTGVTSRKLGKWERIVAEVVGEMATAQSEGIEVEAVLSEAVRRVPREDESGRDMRKQMARRALLKLSEGEDAPWMIEGDCLSMLV